MIDLEAVCDLDFPAAEAVAREMGFAEAHPDLESLLCKDSLDAIIAVTPVHATAQVACRIMEAGIPLLMEKPLGESLEEARHIAATATRTGTPVMVGLDRRFDPVLTRTAEWLRGRPVRWVSIRLHRKDRTEAGFIEDVIIHPLDVLAGLFGSVEVEAVLSAGADMGEAFHASLKLGPAARGTLECLPHCGQWVESYAFAGPGFRVEARSREVSAGRADGEPPFHYVPPGDGRGRSTYGETKAFLEGVLSHSLPGPGPGDVIKTSAQVDEIARLLRSGNPSPREHLP